MQIYDIFYPGQSLMDSGVMNLDAAISYLKPHELAVATNTNWDRHVYYAWEGAWLSESELPENASLAYKTGPAWNQQEAGRLDYEARNEFDRVEALITQIQPVTMYSKANTITLSVDREGMLLFSGDVTTDREVALAYAFAPADWRAKVECARMAYIAAESKRAEAQALRGR